jgi:beta-galactosidase
MRTGVCYYPEQWPSSRWATDAAMMADLGLDLVRIGEFAWSAYEPSRDAFDWGWLDRAIETLAAAGLEVVLGTPTATPPVWLVRERPEVLSVGPDGRRRAYGSRRHTCPTSPAYREESVRVVTALAERYGSHEAVTAWQVDNEPGNHDSARCWCDACQDAFVGWLEERYGTIEALDEAWGTVFWSGTYGSFDAVRLPVPTMTAHTPSLELAHRRFASHQATSALGVQRQVLAEHAPGRDVFTNLYLGDVDVDAREVARPTGLGAVDVYPHGLAGPADVGFVLDLARGSALPAGAGAGARGGRAWVVEQQPGPVNWTGDNPAVPPGQVRLWCWQAALHGIETLLWFRWRAARAGQEQHHAALLRHDGTPDHAHAEAALFIGELREVDPAVLERPQARIALVHEHDDAWLLDLVPHVPGAAHRRLVTVAHAAARSFGEDVDIVPADADLAGYAVVLAPGLHQVTAARLGALRSALEAGATVVVGPRALVRDADGLWSEQPPPVGLAALAGWRLDHAGSSSGWPRATAQRTGSTEPWVPEDTGWATVDDAVVGPGASELAWDAEVSTAAGPWLETYTEVDAAPEGGGAGAGGVGGDAGGADGGAEVLARARGGALDGAPVVLRSGGLVLMGASSFAAWQQLLRVLLDATPSPGHLEVLRRVGRDVVLDHARLTVRGL